MKLLQYLPFILSFQLGFAQSFVDYEWKADMLDSKEIPEAFLQEDAVYIYNETYSRGTFTGTFPYIEQLSTYRNQYQVKILKEAALEDFNTLILQKFKGRIADYVQYKHADVRIKKSDGSIKEYFIRKLPEKVLDEEDKNYDARDDYYFISIEDLEVGDELEVVTIIESKFPDQGRIVNFYQKYPVLQSNYTISVPLKVKLIGNIYNGMANPEVTSNSTNRIYKWEMKDLKAIPEANSSGTIATEKLEYFIYELNFDAFRSEQLMSRVVNYADQIYQYADDFMKVRVRKKKKLEEFYDELFAKGAKMFGKETSVLTDIEKVYMINEFIVKEMKPMGREMEDYEKSEGIEYFLTKKETDYRNLMRIYRDFFERNQIPYYIGIAKNRFSGPIDLNFVSNTQISEYFFVFKSGDNFFSINGYGGLNELPWSYYNTDCYIRDITDRQAELQKINFGDAMLNDPKNNKKFKRSQVQINLKNNEINMKVNNSSSGLFARASRSGIINGYKADTLTKTLDLSFQRSFESRENVITKVSNAEVSKLSSSPLDFYALDYKYDLKINNLIKTKEDQFSMRVSDLMGHAIRNVVNAENRSLDYHVPFLGKDICEAILVFDRDVTIENLDEMSTSVNNEFASYELKITKLKGNMYRIKSTYEPKKLFISKEDAVYLDEANKAFRKFYDAKLIMN